jgi:hypothetical protein
MVPPDTILTPADLRKAASTALRRKRLQRPEEELQRATVERLYAVEPIAIWFHVPNQRANRTMRAILSGLGVKAGVADLIFLWGGGCGAMELKAGKGRLSASQRVFRDECRRLGIGWELIRESEEAVRALESWGVAMKRKIR